MIGKIPRELTGLEDIDDATSDWVLIWAQRVGLKRWEKRDAGNYKRGQGIQLCQIR